MPDRNSNGSQHYQGPEQAQDLRATHSIPGMLVGHLWNRAQPSPDGQFGILQSDSGSQEIPRPTPRRRPVAQCAELTRGLRHMLTPGGRRHEIFPSTSAKHSSFIINYKGVVHKVCFTTPTRPVHVRKRDITPLLPPDLGEDGVTLGSPVIKSSLVLSPILSPRNLTPRTPDQRGSLGLAAKDCPKPQDMEASDFSKELEILHVQGRGLINNRAWPKGHLSLGHPQNPNNLVVGTKAANTQMMISELSAVYLNKFFPGCVSYTVEIGNYSTVKNPNYRSDRNFPETIRVAKNIKCVISLQDPQDHSKKILDCTQEIDVFGCDHPPKKDFEFVSQALRTLISDYLKVKPEDTTPMAIDQDIDGEEIKFAATPEIYRQRAATAVAAAATVAHDQRPGSPQKRALGEDEDSDSLPDIFAPQGPDDAPSPAPPPSKRVRSR